MLAFLVPGRKDADARDGSNWDQLACLRHVRFSPDSWHQSGTDRTSRSWAARPNGPHL